MMRDGEGERIGRVETRGLVHHDGFRCENGGRVNRESIRGFGEGAPDSFASMDFVVRIGRE